MAFVLHLMSASVNQDTEGHYAITSVHQENGASLARRTACAKMGPAVIHSTASVSVPEAGPVIIAIRNVLLIDMDKTVAKSVVVETVEVVTTFLENAIALLVIQDLFAMTSVHLVNTAMNVNRSASARTVDPVILQQANAIVHLDGRV